MVQSGRKPATGAKSGMVATFTGVNMKNTFIDFNEEDPFMNEVVGMQPSCQFSEPMQSLQRQKSVPVAGRPPFPRSPLGANQESWENMEPEGEPAQPQFSQRDWSSSVPGLSAPVPPGPVYTAPVADFAGPWRGSGAAGQAPPAARPQAAAGPIQMPANWADTTTVMMRNIPNKYTQDMLLKELDTSGFMGCYDFLYLPIDPDTNANRGYAFVNFEDAQVAWRFKATYEGRKMPNFNSTKYVSVTPATLQGFDANYAHYSEARVSRGDRASRPLFLRQPTGNAKASGGGRSRRRRGQNSAVDRAAKGQGCPVTGAAERLQQNAQAMRVSRGTDQGAELMNAMAVAQSATAVAVTMAMKQACNLGGVTASAPHIAGEPEIGMSIRFCPFCGGEVGPKSRFCQYCGTNLARCTVSAEACNPPVPSFVAEGFGGYNFAAADMPNAMWLADVNGA